MSQGRGVFPALNDNVRKPKPRVLPLPIKKFLAPPPPPKKKGR